MRRKAVALLIIGLGLSGRAVGQTNSWLGTSGPWQTPTQWSLHAAPSANQTILVTNASTFTVIINDATAAGSPTTMKVSSLSVSNPLGSTTLLLTNTPASNIPITFTVTNSATIGLGSLLNLIDASASGSGVLMQVSNLVINGSVTLQNGSTLSANGASTTYNVHLGSTANSTGSVSILGGSLTGNMALGEQGLGSLVLSNGFLQSSVVGIGTLGGGRGAWQIAGGTGTVSNALLGLTATSTGEVIMTGGLLNAGTISVGTNGSGSVTLSNGTINATELDFAKGSATGVGILAVAGGRLNLSANMYIGNLGTGTVWLTGGEMDVTNIAPNSGLIRLVGSGLTGTYSAQLVCSGGVLRATEVDVGQSEPSITGTSSWTIAGGTSVVNNVVSVLDHEHTGLLTISGGVLQTPLLNVGSISGGGAVMISGGAVLAQSLYVGLAPPQSGTSLVTVAGGSLMITNGAKLVSVGGGGAGQIIVSSGTFNAGTIMVGSSPSNFGNQPGTLSISGGTVKGNLFVGENNLDGSTGTVWITGGNPPDNITIGDTGIGNIYVQSNVVFHPAGIVTVGNQSGGVGSLNLQGGTSFASREIDLMKVGAGTSSTGTVWVTDGLFQAAGSCGLTLVGVQGSGRLSATNSTLQLYSITIGSQGTVECVGSELLLIGSCTTVNNNFISLVNSTLNSYGPVNNVGTIIANNSTLTFLQPVNNSGCIVATNSTVLFSGGITNSGAVLLSPNQFCVTSITATGSDVVITWPAFGGNHYRVQTADSPTDTFSDVTADIVAAGSGLGVTNYVDAGALTNNSNLFYRIHQVY